ncbi:hypothetical protein C7293_14650 [filamentous cyanobacterium CCT1]|nr:hypothetical protein C7293_14650 [filamentous cyanobacterium CCT1]
MLNFVDESIDSGFPSNDLIVFLNELYNELLLVLEESGRHSSPENKTENYIAEKNFERGVKFAYDFANRFTELALSSSPAPAAVERYEPVDSEFFFSNKAFGKTLKYLIAWDNLCRNVLSESAYFSQAHLLEARTDINASIEMAISFYYKQSFQILRGFLESSILPVYFCDQPSEFEKWRSNDYRVPAFRGKNGLLKKMVDSSLISSELCHDFSELYCQLNGSIHGGEKYLVNKGIHSRSWSGLLFKEEDFLDWCETVSRAIALGSKLLFINVNQLKKIRDSSLLMCLTCHNSEDLGIDEFVFGCKTFKQYSCAVCGHKSTLDEFGRLSHIVTAYEN